MDKLNYVSAAEAVRIVKSGMRVFLHGSAATPITLIKALQERKDELHYVELVSITTLGDVQFDEDALKNNFFINSLFVSTPTRQAVNSSCGDYVPVFLSEIPLLFKRNILPIDV